MDEQKCLQCVRLCLRWLLLILLYYLKKRSAEPSPKTSYFDMINDMKT
jgi:hypothetical protein